MRSIIGPNVRGLLTDVLWTYGAGHILTGHNMHVLWTSDVGRILAGQNMPVLWTSVIGRISAGQNMPVLWTSGVGRTFDRFQRNSSYSFSFSLKRSVYV